VCNALTGPSRSATGSDLAELLKLVDEGTISGKIAKTVFEEMARSGRTPRQIVEEQGLVQISDSSAIDDIVSGILAANPEECRAGDERDTRSGKSKAGE
jgi:aspartyl-tRNA(Asn)/glutamyl-tRNA(Gln) amidotransferase subunit B